MSLAHRRRGSPRRFQSAAALYRAVLPAPGASAFVAGKIGVTDCPPLILLTARFSLAGVLILGISAVARRGVVARPGATSCVLRRARASPTTRSISGLGYYRTARPCPPASAA